MSSQVTNYKCPNCGGPLRFDPEKQLLVCDHCGATYTNEQAKELFGQQDQQAAAVKEVELDEGMAAAMGKSVEEAAAAQLKAYQCPSCGATLICDEHSAATSCPYCGNPTIVPGKLTGGQQPELVLPFKKDKQAAKETLKEFYHGKPFLPKVFVSQNHIEEIKGVYVPFWLYNGTVDVNGTYNAERSNTFKSGDSEVTEVNHYALERAGTISFEQVPADASSKMPDDLMDAIEPYDYSDLVKFETSYLVGYMADNYDVSAEENKDRVTRRMSNSAVDAVHDTITGYTSYNAVNEDAKVRDVSWQYVLLPVWLLATRWQGKTYLFAMNGQNGRMVSDDLPIDKTRRLETFLITFVIAAALLFLLGTYMFMGGSN